MKYKQRGDNPGFPKEFENTWSKNQKIPEWLSDSGRILEINDSGEPVLDMSRNNLGDTEIRSHSGGTLVILPESGVLIYSKTHGIQGLTQKQLEILYKNVP